MADTWQAASNLDNLLNQVGFESEPALGVVGSLFGTLADLSGTIGLVQFISGLIAHDNELKPMLNAIQDGFKQLEGQIAASDKLQRMRDVDEGIYLAVGVFEQLPAILTSTPPASQDFKLQQIQTCEDAVLFFTDYDDKWQSAWADLKYYRDPWSGTLAPQPDAYGLVFNHTYTLPQFLRAIFIFLTAVRALAPSSLIEYQVTLKSCLGRLESVHQTIISGIVGTRMPNADEIFKVTQDPDTLGWTPTWVWLDIPSPFPAWPYGAVEIYSGASNVSGYLEYNPSPIPDLLNSTYSQSLNFGNVIRLRIIRKQKDLYRQLGLPVVRSVINQLRQLTGQALLTEAYEAWSAGEVFSILDLPPARATGVVGGSSLEGQIAAIESALTDFLLGTPPYTGYWTYNSDWRNPNNNGPGQPSRPPRDRPINPDDGSDIPPWDGWQEPLPLPTGSIYTYLTGASLGPVLHL
jgi:hypothetical protein